MDPTTQGLPLEQEQNRWQWTLKLSFQSLGIVFGQLSIGPLYVFSTVGPNRIKSEEMLFGLLSFIFWTMTVIPLAKYAFVVLNADDNGEGGTFALYSLLCRHAKVGLLPHNQVADDTLLTYEMESFYQTNAWNNENRGIKNHKKRRYLMLFMALIGSSMVISNGILVPALSVFSASVGLKSLAGSIYKSEDAVVPTACAVLVALFMLQHHGTHKVGFLFAPIIISWLLLIGGVGFYNILHINPHVVVALSPQYLCKFMKNINIGNWRSLSGILLCMAGSEAMFANLGHFSKKSIKAAFIFLVYPSLVLCYMGQTAYLSKNMDYDDINYVTHLGASMPNLLHHSFAWLSLLASAVGSQATITATFSIINQCITLGSFPKVKVVHTSDNIQGQVYIPDINWILMLLCLCFTIFCKSLHHIGNATGFATIIGMTVTTCFMSFMIGWHWNKPLSAICFITFFGIIEAIYFVACSINFLHGTWILVLIAVFILIIMMSWHYGTVKMHDADVQNKVSIEYLTGLGQGLGITRVPGIGFVCTDILRGIPSFFSHFITHFPAFHQILIFVSFKSVPVARVPPSMQCLIGRLGAKENRMYRCILRHGYADNVIDINVFENQMVNGIWELISQDDMDNKIIVASNFQDDSTTSFGSVEDVENGQSQLKKKVRFFLPENRSVTYSSVREELQDLVDAQEQGTTYLCSQPILSPSSGSNFLRKSLIEIYIVLQNNFRRRSMVVNIPNAAYVEVAMAYSI